MSKTIKSLIERELGSTFKNVESVAVISPQGLDGKKNNQLRKALHGKGIKMTVVKNSLARRAASTTKLKGFEAILNGPSAVLYGEKVEAAAIARLLVDEKKTNDKLELRGVFFDGEAYVGEAGVKQVSTFPTRQEAIADILGAIMGPARSLAASLNQAGNVASLIQAVIDKKEKEGAAA